MFDAGCAIGFLVEMLWDRGVEAHGRDISEFAISEVRADVRSWCQVGSIAEPIEGSYDLVLCIEVLEHMQAEDALAAIRNMTAVAPRILFSSSPTDLKEETHINVRPTRYWLERFAEAGFAPAVDFDATFLCPHAMLLERSEEGRDERALSAFAEIVRQRLKAAEARQNEARSRASELAEAQSRQALQDQVATLSARISETTLAGDREVTATARQLRQQLTTAEIEASAVAKELRQQLHEKNTDLLVLRAEAMRAEDNWRRERAAEVQKRLALEDRARAAEMRLSFIEKSKTWLFAKSLGRLSTLGLTRRMRVRRDNKNLVLQIRETGLFSDAYYREHNPDVAASGMDLALHYGLTGWKENRRPGPNFDPVYYVEQNSDVAASGMNPLLHYAQYGRSEGRQAISLGGSAEFLPSADGSAPHSGPLSRSTSTVRALIRNHGASWAPLPVFADERAEPTLTILTDGVDANHLFGGVGTALVVGAMAAKRMGARLRLVTRFAAADPAVLGNILRAHGVDWSGDTDFVYMPLGGDRPLPLGDRDLILTTSWWGTQAVLGSVDAKRVLYLLQEDERMFYPFGDLRLRCSETLSTPDLRVLINTRLLFDHLADGPDALPRLHERGFWFNPAFPAFPRPQALEKRNGKLNFFFYARPTNDRNLYWRGLEVIDTVMREGLLPPSEWNIHFVGRELPDMELPGGVRPTVWSKLPWLEYAGLISGMDLGLSLMDTPHPSYPPIDLAASGAIVVTNSHGIKTDLTDWSRNILVVPPSVPDLCDALKRAVSMVQRTDERLANCMSDNIPRDWQTELNPAFERLFPTES